MKSAVRFILNEFFYNGHFQTLGALAVMIFAGQMLSIRIGWSLMVIIYFAFYLIYLYDRYKFIEVDSITNRARSEHIKVIYKYIPFVLVAGIIVLMLLLYRFNDLLVALITIGIILFGFLYPLYFKKLTKVIIAFKDVYVALFFTLLAALPIIYYKIHLTRAQVLLLIIVLTFTFLRALMMQIFLDFKDVVSDKKEGLMTFAVIWEEKKVFVLVNIVNIVTALSLPVLYFVFPALLLPSSVVFLVILIPLDFLFFVLARRGVFAGFILGSGEFIYWPILVFFGGFLKF